MNCQSLIRILTMLEVIGFWVVLFYNHDREVYLVNLVIGARVMLMIVGIMR
jgi:hypothetical protein